MKARRDTTDDRERCKRHLLDLARNEGPLVFLNELEKLLAAADPALAREIAALFGMSIDKPLNRQPARKMCKAGTRRYSKADWREQEARLASLVSSTVAA